jgi:O-antigen ligase
VAGAAVGTSAVVGIVLAANVPLGVALLMAAIYAPLVLFAPVIGLAVFVALVFLEGLPAFNAAGKASGLLIAAAWVGVLQTGRLGATDVLRRHRRLFEALVLLLIWLCLSLLWAENPATARASLWHWFAVALLFSIVATMVTDLDALRLVALAFVAGALLSVVVGFAGGLVNTGAAADAARLEGTAGDPNFLAAGVVSALVLAAGLMVTARHPLMKLALLSAIGVLAYGLVASQSRGGLVAVLVVLLAAFVFFKRRRAYVALMALVLVGAAAAFFSATPDALDRITSATNGGSGRSGLWTVAWRATGDYPVTGVGLENFSEVSRDYTRQPGVLERVQKIAEQDTVVHNMYLQMLVETGIVGLALFGAVIVLSVSAAWQAGRMAERRGDGELEVLARAVLVATLGILAASFFISAQVDRRVWILLALGPAALAIARRRGETTAQGSS